MQENVEAKRASIARLKLIDLPQMLFSTKDGKLVTVSDAAPQEFDDFITQYVDIENVDRAAWPLLLRWKALNFAIKEGHSLALDRQA